MLIFFNFFMLFSNNFAASTPMTGEITCKMMFNRSCQIIDETWPGNNLLPRQKRCPCSDCFTSRVKSIILMAHFPVTQPHQKSVTFTLLPIKKRIIKKIDNNVLLHLFTCWRFTCMCFSFHTFSVLYVFKFFVIFKYYV